MKSTTKQIARQRIQILFRQAKKVHATDPHLSSRYVATARKIAMSARMPLPMEYRHQICKNCNSLLVQGENCRVRVRQRREPHVVVTCLNCGFQTRIPLRKKKEKAGIEQDNHSDEAPR
ncbi:MAG: hypothetical protein NWE99_06365 [Candidatus Bathyarchaeota archaeon]|nr:hypothetical protein [Candidatus Bathyarchaeota archaeon]